jgi:hypothetical protein
MKRRAWKHTKRQEAMCPISNSTEDQKPRGYCCIRMACWVQSSSQTGSFLAAIRDRPWCKALHILSRYRGEAKWLDFMGCSYYSRRHYSRESYSLHQCSCGPPAAPTGSLHSAKSRTGPLARAYASFCSRAYASKYIFVAIQSPSFLLVDSAQGRRHNHPGSLSLKSHSEP